MERMNSFDSTDNIQPMKKAVIIMNHLLDDSCSFEVAIGYKNSIKFSKGATHITVDDVKIYLTGRCSHIIDCNNNSIPVNNNDFVKDDLNPRFDEIKNFYEDYLEE